MQHMHYFIRERLWTRETTAVCANTRVLDIKPEIPQVNILFRIFGDNDVVETVEHKIVSELIKSPYSWTRNPMLSL